MTKAERAAICPDCGCVAFKKSQHASRCPRGSDPTGAKLDRMMRRDEANNAKWKQPVDGGDADGR